MKINRTVKASSLAAAAFLMMAASGNATTVTYSTNGVNTGFNNTTSNVLSQTSGQTATLTYIDNINSTSGVPSNIDYGNFKLVCTTCSAQAGGIGATFADFTFNLMIIETAPDTASGIFVGTATGGVVYSDVSPITISWAPLQLGPGTAGASSGNFGMTDFQIVSLSRIVAPNSGVPAGVTTIQGNVASTTPEPATFGLIGSALIGIAVIRRRKLSVR